MLHHDHVQKGPNIAPEIIIQHLSADDWEIFIEECLSGIDDDYKKVVRLGGAGDEGVDVGGMLDEKGFLGRWHNYQCKRYDHPLRPSDIWLEIGKMCFYSLSEKYSVPEKYVFVAPQGVGPALSKMLNKDGEDLKSGLIEKWESDCKTRITKKQDVELSDALLDHINGIDFRIFEYLSPLEIIKIHKNTSFHIKRFGGGLPERPSPSSPPEQLQEIEANYVKKLLAAYSEFLERPVANIDDLQEEDALKKHLEKARREFYYAESLQNFSRDYLPGNEFEQLQDQIYAAVELIIMENHNHGLDRVNKALQQAYNLPVDSHPLKDRIQVQDKGGVCHQLANNNLISWANDEQN